MVAKVVLNNKDQNIDKIFDYEVPEALANEALVGMRVKVPLVLGTIWLKALSLRFPKKASFRH